MPEENEEYYTKSYVCMYVCMYVCYLRSTSWLFTVLLGGPLTLARPSSVLVKNINIFVNLYISLNFNSVHVKIHDSKHRLTQRNNGNAPLRGPERFPLKKLFFFQFCSCYNSYFQSFCHKQNKFANLFCLFTYIHYVKSFASGNVRKTITYKKGL